MRYMLLLYNDFDRPEPDTPEAEEMRAEYMAFHDECRRRGVLIAADPLHKPETATTIRIRDGQTLSTDGPFAEATEWLGGYFMVDCDDLDEALELARLCPAARTGSVEVRPIVEVPERTEARP